MSDYELGLGLAGSLAPSAYGPIAAAAEAAGFDAITVFGDLMFQPPALVLQSMVEPTDRIRLGVAAYNPWLLHPVEIAGQVAYLDLASKGRAFFGLARGAWLDQLRIDQTRSLDAVEDVVEIVRRLLAGDDIGYAGKVYSLESGTKLMYQPLRQQVPLLVGTWSPRLARYAGQVADEIQAGGSSNPAIVSRIRNLASAGGGYPKVCLNAVTVVDEDRDRALAAAREAAALYFEVIARFDPTISVDQDRLAAIRTALSRSDHRAAGALIPPDVLRKFAFAGTPEDVAQQAAEIIDAGAHRVEFDTPFGLDHAAGLDLLCQQVLPRVRSLLGR
jgi:5,10-methylenetetrahydromethanopterin reductase